MPPSALRFERNKSHLWILIAGCLFLVSCSESPTSPFEISKLSLGAAYDVYVEGRTAFVSNNRGIAILDLEDIRNPRRIGLISENSSGSIVGFHLSGDTLFSYGERFSVYALNGSVEPELLSSFSGRDYVRSARMQGPFLYLGYLHGGLEVVDYGDPSNPTSLGYVTSEGRADAMLVSGSFVYVANPSTGLEIFNVEDPSDPVRIGAIPGTAGAQDIHLRGSLLFLACNIYGVRVLDFSDPAEPVVMGSFDNGGETWGIFPVGNRLYTVDLAQGVEVLDIESPTHPTLIMVDRHYRPHDVYSDGEYLYLADQDQHFVVLPLVLNDNGMG